MVGRMLLLLLQSAGHAPELVSDGDAAVQLLAANPERFEVLITDHHMPRVKGLELVQRARAAHFDGHILVHCSALPSDVLRNYEQFAVHAVLEKGNQSTAILKELEKLWKPSAVNLSP